MTIMDNEEKIKAAARDWLLRMSLESPTEQERAQWAAWCAEDSRHAAAYRRFETIWQDAATLEELKPFATLPPARDAGWRRLRASLVVHPLRWAASASLATAITGIGFWFLLTPAHYATGIAEVRDIHLSDGSEVTLGARSSLEVAFRLHERRVALTSGVAFFSVAKNPSRPFIVRVGDKEVRVVGTKFEIRRDPASMQVSVVEGTVEVMQVPERANETSREVSRTARKSHSPGMPWDFVIINISPPEGEGPKLNMTRAEVIRKLFPDIEDYVKGERQRWALTVNHWDEDLVEIDVTRDPLSVYYPLDPPAKKK